MAFTDDDGANWTISQGSGINSAVDHQTVGGPYARNIDGTLKGGAIQLPGPNGQLYPNAIYYASQDIGLAEIARSDNGGFTFGVAIPMWTVAQCDGLHGHIKVAPDGTVYVPNKNCGGEQGVAVSVDNGLSWSSELLMEALLATLILRSESALTAQSISATRMAMDMLELQSRMIVVVRGCMCKTLALRTVFRTLSFRQ